MNDHSSAYVLQKPKNSCPDGGRDVCLFHHDGLPPVLIEDVLPMLKAGWGDARIAEALPYLRDSKIPKARAYYNAKVRKQNAAAEQRSLRVLCDENISPQHVYACQDLFNMASYTDFECLTGKPDTEVWLHAVENGYDFIVTKDIRNREASDLTYIAIEAWREAILDPHFSLDNLVNLPLLLNLRGKAARDGESFHRAMAPHVEKLIEYRRSMYNPFLMLNGGTLKPRVILDDGVPTPMNAFFIIQTSIERVKKRAICREESWAKGHLVKTMSREAFYDRETRAVVRLKRAATRAVAIARKRHVPDPLIVAATTRKRRASMNL